MEMSAVKIKLAYVQAQDSIPADESFFKAWEGFRKRGIACDLFDPEQVHQARFAARIGDNASRWRLARRRGRDERHRHGRPDGRQFARLFVPLPRPSSLALNSGATCVLGMGRPARLNPCSSSRYVGTRDSRPSPSTTSSDVLSAAHLADSEEVLAVLRSLPGGRSVFVVLPALRRQHLEVVDKGDFDLLHLACHGSFGGRIGGG